jgi:hypothetical protein
MQVTATIIYKIFAKNVFVKVYYVYVSVIS